MIAADSAAPISGDQQEKRMCFGGGDSVIEFKGEMQGK